MTGRPNQPPWRVLAALLLSLASFVYCTALWKRRAPLLQGEYIRQYLLPLPGKHAVIYQGKRRAELLTEGVLVRRSEPSDPAFRAWLQEHIYEGMPWYRVLWLPLTLSVLLGLPVLFWGVWRDGQAQREGKEGKVLRGAQIISHWQWNLPFLFRKGQRGFYIESK